MIKKAMIQLTLLASTILLLSACAPKVGSDAWCKSLAEKPKGDWSPNEVTDYAKHCVLK